VFDVYYFSHSHHLLCGEFKVISALREPQFGNYLDSRFDTRRNCK